MEIYQTLKFFIAVFCIAVLFLFGYDMDIVTTLNDPGDAGILEIGVFFGLGVFLNIVGHTSSTYLLSKIFPETRTISRTTTPVRKARVESHAKSDLSKIKKEFIWYCPSCFNLETKPLPERMSAAMQRLGVAESLVFKDLFGSDEQFLTLFDALSVEKKHMCLWCCAPTAKLIGLQ